MASSSNRSIIFILILAALILAGFWVTTLSDGLVVYCAHDAVYSKQILDDFTRQTGIRVQVRFDTEATKSLGLINLIVQERNQPRCDVFWNNELLGTKELQEQGLLAAYCGSAWQRIPARYRDPEGHWVGFAARLRVYLVNTDQLPATEEAVRDALQGDLSHVAIAKPMFGTTLTQYSLMWQHGAEELKAWHADIRQRGIKR